MNTVSASLVPSSRPGQIRRPRPSLCTGASIAVCLLALARPAEALDGTWTSPATGLWSDSLNWLGGNVADGVGGTANFGTIDLPGDIAVHLDTARTIGNLIFGDVNGATTPGGWLVDNNGDGANILTLQAAAPTITVNALGAGKSVTIEAEIAGIAGLSKAGVGTLILTGVNSYTGTTTVSAGTLVAATSGAIGTFNAITLSGGTLDLGGLSHASGAVTITAGTLSNGSLFATSYAAQAGTVSASLDGGGLTKTGAGTLTLSGVNTYAGATAISGGILAFGSAASIGGSGPSVTVAAAATAAANYAIDQAFLSRIVNTSAGVIALGANSANSLDFSAGGANLTLASLGATGAFSFTGTLVPNVDVYRLGGGGGNLILSSANILTGASSLAVTNGGLPASIVTLGAANDFTGGTTISSGTLVASVSGALGAATNALTAAGGTLDLGAASHTQGTVTISGGTINNGTLTGSAFDGRSGTVGASLAGTGVVLTKTTNGTLTLNGTNTYTGGTTINAGVLAFGSPASIAGSGANVVINSGGAATATYGVDQAFLNRVAASSTGAVAIAADNANALNFTGLSTASLGATGTFSYTGTLTPNAGVYRLGGGGGTLTLSGTNALTGANSLVVTVGGFAGSRVALTGANNYSGGTTISGGLLAFSALNNLGTGGITFDGGTLQWAGTNTADISTKTVTFGAGGATLDLVANNVTLANAIGNSGPGSLTKIGAGTLTLNGANTYSGGTVINAGVVSINGNAALGASAGGVTFSGSSTLRFGAAFTVPATRTLTSNTGVTATLDTQGNATTVASPLAGAGAFTKLGSALLTYTGTGTTTGNLNVSGGIFQVNPGGNLTVNALTTAATAGVQFVVAGGAFVSNAQSTIAQTGAGFLLSSGSATFNNGIQLANSDGAVIKVTGGTFTASNVNIPRDNTGLATWTSGFIVQGGTVDVQTLGVGTNNSLGHASFEGGTTTIHGAITVARQTSATGGTVRGGALRVINAGTVFVSEETVDGIIVGRTPASVATTLAQTAEVRFSGGTSTAEKITFQYDANVRGTGTVFVNGGALYLGSGGMVKKDATAGQTIAINLTGGLLGAKAAWSTVLPVTTGTTATNNIEIKTADQAGVARDIELNGGVTGTGGFTKTGAGKLTVAGNSSYTGGSVGTTISAGTLQVGNGGTAGTLGTSVITNNSLLIFDRSDALAFANNIGGTGAVEQNGGGTTTLSGTNTYAGSTTINAGTLRVSSSLASSTITVNSPGTLAGTGPMTGAVTVNSGGRLTPSDVAGTAPGTMTLGSLTLSSGSTLDFDFASLSTFDKVVVTGTNGLTINGAGLNLYTSNTTNPWTIPGSYNLFQFGGSLGGLAATNLNAALSVLNPEPSLTYDFSSTGGFITLVIGTPVIIPTWNSTGGGSWNTPANWTSTVPNAVDATAKFGTSITAPSTVTLNGDKTVGTLEFGSPNSYTIAQGSSGTLTLSKSSGNAAIDNVSGTHAISAPVSLASNTVATVFDANDALTISGSVSGGGSLTKSGLGKLILTNANSHAGGTILTAGTLQIQNDQALSTPALFVSATSTLQFGADNLVPINDIAIDAAATLTVDTLANTATLAGIISGGGSLTKVGTGRLDLPATNSYTGPTTINGGTVSAAILADGDIDSSIGNSAAAAANLVLNGGTLEYTGGDVSTNRLFRLGTGGGTISAMGSGAVSFTNPGAITFAGTNTARTLTLTGTNTGNNRVSAIIGNNGTGATSLLKSDTGTWALAGVNTFTGETVISGGTLVLGNTSALAGSTLNYNNQGGVVDFGILTQAILGGLTGAQDLGIGSKGLTIGGNGQTTTYSGSLSGATSLTKNGVGTLILTGTNTLAGPTTITAGTLEVATGGSLVTTVIEPTTSSALFHQTGGTVTAGTLDLENVAAVQLKATFDGGTATFTNTPLGSTDATSAPAALTINNGTIALGAYSSLRDGSNGFNTTAGLIIHGGTVTATSLRASTGNSWSNVTLTGGSLTIGDASATNAFFLGGGTNNVRGGGLTMTGGTLTYLGTDGLVLNRGTGTGTNNSVGQATFSGGLARLTGITLNAATVTGGSSTLAINAATVYLGAVGLDANTTAATASVTLNGATLGALAPWSGTANITLGINGVTFQAADEANVAQDINLLGQISGSGSLTKTGPGTLTLKGQNSYTGATTVNAGTLIIEQSFTTGSSLVIGDGATVVLAESPAPAPATPAAFDLGNGGSSMQEAMATGGGVAAVPEPGALSLLAIGAIACLRRRRSGASAAR